MTITIRSWTKEDLPDVRRILWDTWLDAYSKFIPQEDLESYFTAHYSIEKLTGAIGNTDMNGDLALANEIPSAMSKTYHNRSEGRLYLQQLYVHPTAQNLGLGRQLMTVTSDRAKSLNYDRIWLGVMTQNESAFAWYRALGFTTVEQNLFTMGNTSVDHYIGYVPCA